MAHVMYGAVLLPDGAVCSVNACMPALVSTLEFQQPCSLLLVELAGGGCVKGCCHGWPIVRALHRGQQTATCWSCMSTPALLLACRCYAAAV